MRKLVVVIPNYNGAKFVRNCMDSLLVENVPVIVVDNASTDGSDQIMAEYARQYPELVTLVTMETNTGFCGAVNEGITHADAEYVILLNNDTVIEQGFCQALLQRMESDERIFSVSSKMIDLYHPDRMDDAGDLYCCLGWAFSPAKGRNVTEYDRACKVFAACGGAAIYRTSILQKIGTFDENHFAYLEDVDLGYRARLHGYENWFEPKAVVYHAGSGVTGSRHNAFKVSLSSKNSIYLIYKNMYFLQIILNLPFLLLGILTKTLFFTRKHLGIVYCKGICKGIAMCFSKEGRKKKVPLSLTTAKNACKIQLELWYNTLLLFAHPRK